MKTSLHLLSFAALCLVPPLWAGGWLFALPPLVGGLVATLALVCIVGSPGGGDVDPATPPPPPRLRSSLILVAAAILACHTALSLRALGVARMIALSGVSQSNLRGIGQCLHAYCGEFGDYPPTIQDTILTRYLTEGQWMSPGDCSGVETMVLSEGYSSYVYAPGRGPWLPDPSLLLAYERLPWTYGRNDLACPPGFSVLRGDGTVEWLDLFEFEDALREDGKTRRRLGWDSVSE